MELTDGEFVRLLGEIMDIPSDEEERLIDESYQDWKNSGYDENERDEEGEEEEE
jgi:hypothetical protein